VGAPEGPRSSVWQLWVHKNEVYVSARSLASVLKISLHSSGDWHHAFTTEHVAAGSPFVSPGESRVLDKWKRPPELVPGVIKAFEIVVPSSEVTEPSHPKANEAFRQAMGGKAIVWVPAAPEGYATRFLVVFTAPEVTAATVPGDWPGRDTMGTRLIFSTELQNGQTVWVVSRERPGAFQRWVAEGKRQLAEPGAGPAIRDETAPDALEPRAFIDGINHLDGTRFYLDISGEDAQG
jgi:hypothetical protein